MLERKVCSPLVTEVFRDIDQFLTTAQSILQRRKSRAGLSLQNHIGHILKAAGIPFERDVPLPGKPDIVIPGKAAYDDPTYPDSKLFMVGVKTTCKDRWRQVLAEGTPIRTKHILTLQRDISENQLTSMRDHKVQLVVPMHPKDRHPKSPERRFYAVPGMEIWTLEKFVAQVREALTK